MRTALPSPRASCMTINVGCSTAVFTPGSGDLDRSAVAQEHARDDDLLDLRRPTTKAGQLRVAPGALDGEVLDVAPAAMDLDRILGVFRGALRHVGLGHRGLDHVRLALILQPRGVAEHEPGGLQ